MDSSSDSRPPVPEAHAFGPGEKIGRYLLLEQVGEGGMGVVFAAFDPQLNRKIALKILRASTTDADDKRQLRARLFREAQAIAKLSHPHVITVFDVGTVGASVFVAMEFIEGVTLSAWLETPRPLSAVIDVFAQAGRGLSAAHKAGLVHRDFKPDNVLVGFDGVARVSDFGLARTDPSLLAGDDDELEAVALESAPSLSGEGSDETDLLSSPMTQAGAVVGTPRFMAPEQHAGAPPDPRSDQFAFCVALYQALYGQEPFVARTMEGLVQLKQQGRVVEPPQGVSVPGGLEQLVWRGLSADPRRRYPTMEALLEDLHDEPVVRGGSVLRWVVGLGLSSAALGIAALQSPGVRPPPCDESKTSWAGVWGQARKDAIEQAFVAAAPEASGVSWRTVERTLDAYGAAFSQGFADACSAVKGRQFADDTFFQLRRDCLLERRDVADALVALFESPDEALVRAAPQSVAELPSFEPCTEGSRLLARGARSPAQTRQATHQIRRALVQARVYGLAGRIEAGQSRAREALEQAEALGLADFAAEANLVLGRVLTQAGHYIDAEQHLREAVLEATRAAHDEAAAEAAIALVHVLGSRLDRHGEAMQWEAQAAALLDRVGHRGILRARLENRAGRLDARRGAYAEAREHFESALSLRSEARGVDDPGRAAWMIDLGEVSLKQGRYDEAMETFDRALGLAESMLSASHPTRADALAAIGRVHLAREEYGPAKEVFLQAKAGLEASLGSEHPQAGAVVLRLAIADEGLGNASSAEVGFARAASLFGATLGREHASFRRARLGEARCARVAGDLDAAERSLSRACGGPALPASLEGECALETASLRRASGRLEEAAAAFAEAAERFTETPPDARAQAQALLGLAQTMQARGELAASGEAIDQARGAVARVRGYVPGVQADIDRLASRLRRQAPVAAVGEHETGPRTVPEG